MDTEDKRVLPGNKQFLARIAKRLAKIDKAWDTMPDGFWTSAHIPGGSHKDLLKELVRDGVPELAEIASFEFPKLLGEGMTLRDLLDHTTKTLQAVERRLDLEARLQRATVDPLNRASPAVAMLVAALRMKNPGAKEVMAEVVNEWICSGDSESIAELGKLTDSPAGEEHRVHRMLALVLDFHGRHYRFPTFAEARAIVFRREEDEAKNPMMEQWSQLFPAKHDSKEWQRLWKQCGLEWLEKGKAGRPRKK